MSRDELPGRTDQTFFVSMVEEQAQRYAEYEFRAPKDRRDCSASPAHQGGIRTPATISRLHAHDLRHAGDSRSRVPRLPQARRTRGRSRRLLEEPSRKIVVFSEWVTMLQLVRDLAAEMGVDCAWHTGGVPQLRRRAEIARFREDPACRLSFVRRRRGGPQSPNGELRHQSRSAVESGEAEQRIARVWRKGQTRAVTVVNLSPKIRSSIPSCIFWPPTVAGRRRARRGRGFLEITCPRAAPR